jgi:hypothetical protein
MEGILKQQCINDEGLYVWQKKYFKLDVHSLKFDIFALQDAERKTPTFSIPLNSLKYAKEWSFSSAMGGYGFDLVWFSGNDWSFLVENEKDCQEWVKWINEGIALSNGSKKPATISKEVLETINSHKEFLSTLNSESYQEEYASLLKKTKQELSSPITLMNNPQEETKTAAKYENRDNLPVHRRTSNIIHEITQDNPFQGLRSPSISLKNRYDQTNDTEEEEEFKQSSHHHNNNTTLVDQTISPIPNKGSNADSESEHSAPLSIHQYESSTLPPLPPSSNNDNFPSRRASSSNTGAVNFEENNTARRASTIGKPDEAQTTTSSSTRRASTVNNNNHLHQEDNNTNSTTTRRASALENNNNPGSNQTSSRRASSVATPTQETTSPTRRRSTVSTQQETTRRSSTVSHPQEEASSTRRSSLSNNTVQEHPRRSSVSNTPTQQENSSSRRASVTPASPEGVSSRRTSVSAAPHTTSPKRSSLTNTQERRVSVTNSQEKNYSSPSRRSSVGNTPDSTTRRSSVSQGNIGNSTSGRRNSSTGASPDKKENTRQRSPSKRASVVNKENVHNHPSHDEHDSMMVNDRSLHMTNLNNTTTVPNDLSRIFPSTDQYENNTTRYLNSNNNNNNIYNNPNTSDPLSPHRINSQSYQPFAHPPPPPHSYNQPQQHYQQQQRELPLYSSYPSSSTFVTSAMKDQYLSNMKNIFQETKNSLYLTENELQDCRMNNNNITTNLK